MAVCSPVNGAALAAEEAPAEAGAAADAVTVDSAGEVAGAAEVDCPVLLDEQPAINNAPASSGNASRDLVRNVGSTSS